MARPRGRTLPPANVREPLAPRLDRCDHYRLPDLVADRTCPSLFHTREQKDVVLESLRRRSLAEQDGADAVQDGADAQPHGEGGLSFRSANKRQPRIRRIPRGDAAAS